MSNTIFSFEFEDRSGSIDFEIGKPKMHDTGDGFAMVSAKIKLADGTEYDGVIDLDLQSSGEHWGTHILSEDLGILNLHDEDDQKKLGKTKEDILPYKYNYRPIRLDDIHVDEETGWSR